MNFKTAHEKLAKLANGQYFSMEYQITTNQFGESEQRCGVYVHGSNWHSDVSWHLALGKLRRELNPPKVKIESIEEIKNGVKK